MSTPSLADALGEAILVAGSDGGSDGERRWTEPGHELALVRRTADANAVVADLLRQAVAAARAGGHSWSAIGAELGMTRQAVQQRFGDRGARDPDSDDVRWLGPVTAFDEMRELELAGRLGWHTVEAGLLRHRIVRGDTQWEHRRVIWTGSLRRHQADGWEVGCTAFPWVYLVRDTGVPVEA